MKIAHVVTYISYDGAFGGPVAVAATQAQQLAAEGHDVEIIAGWDGVAKFEVPGVKISLHRVSRIAPGFSGLIAPGLMRHLRVNSYDCVHIHLARDLITTPAARMLSRSGQPYVVQAHGMIKPDRRIRARVFDRLAVRDVIARARTVFSLTNTEAAALREVARTSALPLVTIPNGIRWRSRPAGFPSKANPPQVLFLARLHPRKRVLAFAEMAADMVASGVDATFHVVGPDEGDLSSLLQFISSRSLQGRLVYEGTVEAGKGAQRLSTASVFVLPSVGEVFPMTVLESMSVGTPVVLNSDCGIASELERRDAAVIVDGSPESLASATRLILADSVRRGELLANANSALASWLSIENVTTKLVDGYNSGDQVSSQVGG